MTGKATVATLQLPDLFKAKQKRQMHSILKHEKMRFRIQMEIFNGDDLNEAII